MKNKTIWLVEVRDCKETFIVKAENKIKAKNKVYDYLNEIYPPDYLKNDGYKPYFKKDIQRCDKLINLLNIDGILDI